ncbi:MAG: AMP-binding protein [Desulfobacterales bacterium]
MGIEKISTMNLAEIIKHNGKDPEIKNRTFILFREEDESVTAITYDDFYRKSMKYGNMIHQIKKKQGIKLATRFHVGVFMQNIPEFFYILGGCAFTNSTLVGINNAQIGEKLAFDINNIDVNLLIVDHAVQPKTGGTFLDSVTKAKNVHGFKTLSDSNILSISGSRSANTKSIDQKLKQYASLLSHFNPEPLNETNAAVVIFTSGTTGAPKGIEVSWEKLVNVGVNGTRILNYTDTDVGCVCMPINHSNSLYLNIMPAMLNGAKIFLRRKFSVSNFVKDIEISGSTIWNCVGDPVQYLLNYFSKEEDIDYSDLPLRTVISTGTNASNRSRFTKLFGLDIFTEVYGSTEAGAIAAVDANTPSYSVGKVIKDVRILDERSLQECDPAEVDETGRIRNLDRCAGEVIVSQSSLGTSAFTGYYKLPKESSQKIISLHGEEFYRMGDLGAIVGIDHVNYLIFLGRTGDWIRFKGENWAPVDCKVTIAAYRAVNNIGIIGVPQSSGKEDDPMFILQVEDDNEFHVDDFYSFCKKHLPHYMLPRFIRIVESLPMTETMKLKKSLLKKDFYYRDENLDANHRDIIYEIQDDRAVEFKTENYLAELKKFTDPTNQDTLKTFTGKPDLFVN